MRRVASLAVVLLLATSSLAGQAVWFGGGVSIPTGDYGDYAKTGWMANAGVGFPVGQTKALAVEIGGLFGSNSHKDITGDKTTLYGALAGLNYQIGNLEKPHLYVFGGGGFLVHKYSSDEFPEEEGSDTKFAYQFGAGLDIPLEKIGLWADVRYLARAESGATAMIPIIVGIYIPLKRD